MAVRFREPICCYPFMTEVGDLGAQSMGLLLKKEPRLGALSLKSNHIGTLVSGNLECHGGKVCFFFGGGKVWSCDFCWGW